MPPEVKDALSLVCCFIPLGLVAVGIGGFLRHRKEKDAFDDITGQFRGAFYLLGGPYNNGKIDLDRFSKPKPPTK